MFLSVGELDLEELVDSGVRCIVVLRCISGV